MGATTPRDHSGDGVRQPTALVEPPVDLGGHRILRRIGAGGMGAVYLAATPDGGQAALKVLRPDLVTGAREFAARFRRECAVMAVVRHPNVVTLQGSGEDRGWCWLAMEYLPDGDLERYLRRRRQLMERDAVAMAMKCAHGLSALHAVGLVHRDFKPGNVFLDLHSGREPVAKVGDLGLARHADGDDRLTRTGTACGTPAFMAPEQIRAQSDIDARADVYALGATLYRLVTGEDPFTGKSVYVVSQAALKEPVPDPRRLNPALSSALVGVVLKAMAKDREDRFPDVDAMRRDLERVLDGRALTHAAAVPSPASLIFQEVAGQSVPRQVARPTGSGGGVLSGLHWGPVLRLGVPAAIGCAALWGIAVMLGERTEVARPPPVVSAVVPAAAGAVARIEADERGDRLLLSVAGRIAVLRWIPPGRSRQGADPGAPPWEGSQMVHLAHGCWMLDREVDRGLWAAVLGEPVPADPMRPAGEISREDAEVFCQRLNALVPGLEVRLPSEAEWERACRAGGESEMRAAPGDRTVAVLEIEAAWRAAGAAAQLPLSVEDAWRWRREDERLQPRAVAQGAANRWGFYDLIGNQQEWCLDPWDGASPPEAEIGAEPHGRAGSFGVLRGGSWLHPAALCRSGARAAALPRVAWPWTGFRFVVPGGERPALPDVLNRPR